MVSVVRNPQLVGRVDGFHSQQVYPESTGGVVLKKTKLFLGHRMRENETLPSRPDA